MADDDKKRTQEASETNFTTRGGRQDEASGAGKPWTSPCKRRPEDPTEDATVADSPPTLSNALHTIPALADACSARDLLILSCVSKQTATFAEPGVWRRLRDREWPALPGGVPPQVTVPCGHYGPIGPSGTGDDAAALKRMIQTLTNRGVWRSCEAPQVRSRSPADYDECDLLRVNFHTPNTEDERQYHVRVRRILAFVDELFWLDCPAARAPESAPESSSSSGDSF